MNFCVDLFGDWLDVELYWCGEGLCCIVYVMFFMCGVLCG